MLRVWRLPESWIGPNFWVAPAGRGGESDSTTNVATATAAQRIDITPLRGQALCCVAGSLARNAGVCNAVQAERREHGPPPLARGRYGVVAVWLRSVWLPGRMSAPGPGRPAVELITLVLVAPSQKVVTRTPFSLVFG